MRSVEQLEGKGAEVGVTGIIRDQKALALKSEVFLVNRTSASPEYELSIQWVGRELSLRITWTEELLDQEASM